jgi:hypothetical protein
VTTGEKTEKKNWKPPNRRPDLFVMERDFQGYRTGFTPNSSTSAKILRSPGKWLEVQLLFCFTCIQSAFMKLYILPRRCDLYRSHERNSNGLKPSTSPDTLHFVSLPVLCVTLQSRIHPIHTIVGTDNDVINLLSNKFSGVVEIRERGLDGIQQ